MRVRVFRLLRDWPSSLKQRHLTSVVQSQRRSSYPFTLNAFCCRWRAREGLARALRRVSSRLRPHEGLIRKLPDGVFGADRPARERRILTEVH
jgi:hypothetical protein